MGDAMMLTHHLATLTLISGSYLMNMTPIATATMIVHDIADSLLEIAKLFNYMKDARPWAEGVSDGVFVSFAIAFITSRCGVFPYKIIYQGLLLSRNVTVPAFFALDAFTGEELEKELEDKRIAIAKLDKLSSQTKKNK